MSKQLYEEALADVKKIKEIAEDNAKRAVVEAVAPRIRELIERELLGEAYESTQAPEEDNLLTEPNASGGDSPEASGGDSPDEEEKSETVNLESLVSPSSSSLQQTESAAIAYVSKSLDKVEQLLTVSENSQHSAEDLAGLVTSLGKMYEIVNENAGSLSQKLGYNLKIRNCLKKVEKLQENINMKKRTNRLSEADILLKLTGVPEELSLEDLGVELEAAEEEEPSGDEEVELDLGGDEEGEEGASDGEDEEVELDLGGDEEGASDGEDEEVEEAAMYGESRRLNDNVIVEIDEGMLRREIARMKALREAKEDVQTWGHGPGDVSSEEDFEADDMGDPLELSLRESDCDENEMTNEDEMTPKDKMTPEDKMPVESLRRRMAHELKLQETLKSRAASAARLYEAAQARFRSSKTLAERKDVSRRGAEHKAAYTNFAKRYNESVKRFNSLSSALAEASAPHSVRSNNAARKPVASSGDTKLRNKLAETNLLNAKLMFTNKLLQSEALTSRQKSQVIAQLDEAQTLREVKLVYESLAKTLSAPRKTVTESRVLGSSSQATRSASPQTLNEGFESERWAKLAGISK